MKCVTLGLIVPEIYLKNHCTASLPFFKDAEIKLPHWIGSSKSMIININDTYEYYHNSSSDYETET